MTKIFTIAKSTLLVGSALLAANVHAAGFQIVEHSASGLGRAFAGEAAIADNAATLARNPASLSMLETANFTGGISYIDPDVQVQFM
ncbi:outer membrane protein transport protein, partial [Vibrio makurazakiensis]|uniref:outer membrane protein transport protein n=1 Tax=Vibrio makurazakiensis TaxID=2910250 RepID=UPI003D0A8A42